MKPKMMMQMFLSVMAALMTLSCGDDGPYNDKAALYDLVTFEENSADGAVFTFQRRDDSPLITLVAKGTKVSEIENDTRVIIGYYPASGQSYTSGEITLLSVNKVNQDTVHVVSSDKLTGWNATPVYLNSVWRSGEYLNMYMRVAYSEEGRIFRVAVDSATIDDQMPQLYLMHDLLDAPDNFTRRAYLSVDMSGVWSRPHCQGVTLHINDSNLKTETYTFNK